MPSGSYKVIPSIINLALRLDPETILDIGAGFGKWGVLFREYIEIGNFLFEDSPHYGKKKFDSYIYKDKKNWKKTIDGVEVFSEYVGPLHEFVYNTIYMGDVNEAIEKVRSYDLIFCCDVIEHVSREEGLLLIKKMYEKSVKALIIVTPAIFGTQDKVFGNEFEKHRSLWSKSDFKEFKNTSFGFCGGNLIVVLSKAGKSHILFQDNIVMRIALTIYNYLEHRAILKKGVEDFLDDFLLQLCLKARRLKQCFKK